MLTLGMVEMDVCANCPAFIDTVYWAGGGGAASDGRALHAQHEAGLVAAHRCAGDSQSAGVGGRGGGGKGAILSNKETDSGTSQ